MRTPPVIYRDLASYLAKMPLSASVGDIIAHLRQYRACDQDWFDGIVRELSELPADEEAMKAIIRLADLLKRENPRFQTGIWLDWVTDDR